MKAQLTAFLRPSAVLPRLTRRRDGSVMVELALVAGFLALLLGGMIDLGRVFMEQSRLAVATRAGASFGAQDQETAAKTDLVAQSAVRASGDRIARADVGVRRYCACATGGEAICTRACGDGTSPVEYLEVSARKPVDLWFDVLRIASPVTVTERAAMRLQ